MGHSRVWTHALTSARQSTCRRGSQFLVGPGSLGRFSGRRQVMLSRSRACGGPVHPPAGDAVDGNKTRPRVWWGKRTRSSWSGGPGRARRPFRLGSGGDWVSGHAGWVVVQGAATYGVPGCLSSLDRSRAQPTPSSVSVCPRRRTYVSRLLLERGSSCFGWACAWVRRRSGAPEVESVVNTRGDDEETSARRAGEANVRQAGASSSRPSIVPVTRFLRVEITSAYCSSQHPQTRQQPWKDRVLVRQNSGYKSAAHVWGQSLHVSYYRWVKEQEATTSIYSLRQILTSLSPFDELNVLSFDHFLKSITSINTITTF